MASGQFFSQRFSYGLHALAYVATKPAGELTTLPELAKWMTTIWPSSSDTYLSNVVQRIARGKLLRSHSGNAGGYSLGRATRSQFAMSLNCLKGLKRIAVVRRPGMSVPSGEVAASNAS